MTVACPSCAARLAVPDEKARNPALKLKCPGCSTIFPLGVQPGAVRAAPGPAGASTAAAPGPGPAAAPAPATSRSGAPVTVCANHVKVKSESVCAVCLRGYCKECGKRVERVVACPVCDHICVSTAKYLEDLETARRRALPMRKEMGAILKFPFTDPVALVIVGVIVSVFSFHLFSRALAQGLLMAYTFHQVACVSNGKRSLSTPDVSDVTDLARPLYLGFAAFLVSWGPLLAFIGIFSFGLVGGFASDMPTERHPSFERVAHAQSFGDGDEYDDPAAGFRRWITLGGFFVVVGLGWKLFYSPVAFMVAALSKSFVETLKPWVGIATIRRMGSLYGELLGIYTVLMVGQFLVSLPLANVPIAGQIVNAATNVYAYLAAGAAIGMAVEKKAEELGLE